MANTNNSRLTISSLDFDNIKANLKSFLSAQSEFTDYDFEGAGLSVLLDLLAYNTHYTGFYQHMVANELFMDTATLRSSVISRAKLLAYTPRSVVSAKAILDITITPNNSPASIVLERNTRFGATIDGTTYTFITDQAHMATPVNGAYTFAGVTIFEGIPYRYQITVDSTITNQRFVIPNAGVDTSTLNVRVQTSSSNIAQEVFQVADDINLINDQSNVYYLQETEDGLYELQFGDGILGRKLTDGNIVVIDYLLASGPAANGATGFYPLTPVGGYAANFITIKTVTAAFGGSDRETIDEVKFSAPKSFEAQNRAVTIQDYKTLVVRDYPIIESIAVWGGEDHVPPAYGKVFISLKPADGYVITNSAKQLVINDILKKRNMVSVIPQILDPEYTFILASCKVYYDPAVTTKTAGDIANLSSQAISNYGITDLSRFDKLLKYSRLVNAVDSADTAIVNNLIAIKMQKRFVPQLSVPLNYSFLFNNAIQPSTLFSSWVVIAQDPKIAYQDGDIHRVKDDGLGNLVITKLTKGASAEAVVKTNVGTINYTTGDVEILSFMPLSLNGNTDVRLTCTPLDRKSTRLNSSHSAKSRMPSSA